MPPASDGLLCCAVQTLMERNRQTASAAGRGGRFTACCHEHLMNRSCRGGCRKAHDFAELHMLVQKVRY